MEEFEKRIRKDRRRQPTPGLSRYILFGQRKGLRRRIDQEKGGYVDRYSSGLFFILVSIMGLNVLDALLTMMILELGGMELNPHCSVCHGSLWREILGMEICYCFSFHGSFMPS